VFLRSLLVWFGEVTPLEAQRLASGGNLFDSWRDYLSMLGLPDYRGDIPRAEQSNAMMQATLGRLAEALCIKTAARELKAGGPVDSRNIYAFEIVARPSTDQFLGRDVYCARVASRGGALLMNRRTFLKLFGAGAAGFATHGATWAASHPDQFFIFVFAAGGWDVMLWADPRNERKGIVEPPSTANCAGAALEHWRGRGIGGGVHSFEILEPGNTSLRLGPAIGKLYDLRDRLTIINGIATNTVSHPEGVTLAVTGRHASGGSVNASSIDVLLANELGTTQTLPNVAIRFPTYFNGPRLDRRVIPTQISNIEGISKTLARSDQYFLPADRADITTVLSDEAGDLAKRSRYGHTFDQLASQYRTTQGMLSDEFRAAFDINSLRARYPMFNYINKSQEATSMGAGFAIEAIRRNLVRCVGFALGGLDTHESNYGQHPLILRDQFAIIADLVKLLDTIPHPTRPASKLADHTHILVVSEFCRTPQINLFNGRDHYPNNSALVISPRFRGGRSFGSTDQDQLLPKATRKFVDGERAIAPVDVLATFMGAFGIDPRKYLRDGEIMKEMLV
jgi:uncharacterized protein (DUF1501 family)